MSDSCKNFFRSSRDTISPLRALISRFYIEGALYDHNADLLLPRVKTFEDVMMFGFSAMPGSLQVALSARPSNHSLDSVRCSWQHGIPSPNTPPNESFVVSASISMLLHSGVQGSHAVKLPHHHQRRTFGLGVGLQTPPNMTTNPTTACQCHVPLVQFSFAIAKSYYTHYCAMSSHPHSYHFHHPLIHHHFKYDPAPLPDQDPAHALDYQQCS